MAGIDYDSVTADQLELRREPRKSKFSVVHKPTGTVADDPVAPGSLAEVRFRRPTGLPKDNRSKDMIGFIEGRAEGEDNDFWPLLGGENPRNEYLEALAKDPVALKASFEGSFPTRSQEDAKEKDKPAEAQPGPQELPEEGQSESQPGVPEDQPEDGEGSQGEQETVGEDGMKELDDILAGLN